MSDDPASGAPPPTAGARGSDERHPHGDADPLARLVTGYLLEQVREATDEDPELFERAQELYEEAERAVVGSERAERAEHASRLRSVLDHAAFHRVMKMLGPRASHVFETALRVSKDNRVIMRRLRERVERRGLDLETAEGREAAVAEYERVLAETVPLEQSLDNVGAIADGVGLAREFLAPRSRLKRVAFETAWKTLLPIALRRPELRRRVDELKRSLAAQPERLDDLAELVRREGPEVVKGAYRRGGAPGVPAAPAR